MSDVEKRREKRDPANIDINLFVEPTWGGIEDGARTEGSCVDVSLSGFRGRTKHPIEVGDTVTARIGDSAQTYYVRWVRSAGDEGFFEFGCESTKNEKYV